MDAENTHISFSIPLAFAAGAGILLASRGRGCMKRLALTLVVSSALTGVAHAGDKLTIGPAPAWVKPIALPAAGKADEAPARLILSDQQVSLERGRETVYTDVAFKIQTPQGLAAGNISFPWRPDTDDLTVHKLLIRRGDQTIDVLASGQTFTVVRREQNLDSAVLDGVLTANIQPEGLQVGDILEFAATVSSSDPTLKGHVEQIAGAWNGLPVGRAHLRMQWPTSLPLRLRETAALPALKPVKAGPLTSLELSLDNLEPITPPKGAPARYAVGRLIEVTDFVSWADLGALMAPLYEKAATLPPQGALRTELGRIQALSPDPMVRAAAALSLVEDRVRYVALTMGAGGYVPADAETTWSRRFGDCKGKTALLLALLHALSIEAEPVLVSSENGDGLDLRLPMVGLFNHVLVRATIAGRTYWLDGTRTGDTDLNRLTIPAFRWGLPLVATDAALTQMMPPPLVAPTRDTRIRIDASAGIAALAPAKVETIFSGDDALGANMAISNLVGQARDRALRDYWRNQYDFIDVKTANAVFDAKSGELHLTMEGDAKLDWANGNYQTDGTDVGYHADFSRDPGPNRDAPFAVRYPHYTRTQETILLPKGAGEITLGTSMDVDQTAGGIAYHRHATISQGVFTIEKTERSLVPEFPAKNAPTEQAALRMLADRTATLRMPANYAYTGKDIASVRADVPTTSAGYVSRAKIFIDQGLRKEALADYDKAVDLDPANVYAWANRALTRIQDGDLAGAKSDLVKADALDPRFGQNFIARGMIADVEKHPRDAVDGYTEALKTDPDNSYALGHRALSYAVLGDDDHAFADAGAAIKLDPSWIDLYSLRAGIDLKRDDRKQADAEMHSAIAANPKRAFAYVAAARIHLASNVQDQAVKDYDQAIAIEPQAYIYAERSRVRPSADTALRRADIEMALKLDPKSSEALAAKAVWLQDEGDTKASLATWSQAVAAAPNNAFVLAQRAQAQRQAGNYDQALADAAAALKIDPTIIDLYLLRANLLRNQGRTDDALHEAVAVEAAAPAEVYAHVAAANIYGAFHKDAEAMKAYDRAIAIRPEAYIYLNRSLRRPKADIAGRQADVDAALRLHPGFDEALAAKADLQVDGGDLTGAIASYTAALEKSPDDASLLVGRGIVYARSNDSVRSEKDFAAARAKATDAVSLNNLCWSKATAGVALQSALADCNAALAKEPGEASYMDSLGFVLLRLGRFDDAISEYDRALSRNPQLTSSLYGRSVAWRRKGNKAKSDADADASLKIDPDVGDKFKRYGVTL